VPTHSKPGRSFVTRQAVTDLVRTATLGSYGVTGFASRPHERLLERLGLASPGISLRLADAIDLELDLTVAFGVPVAEVARQVDSAVRYSIQHALGRDVGRVTIHVAGLRFTPDREPPTALRPVADVVGPRELADKGSDVA
jgi:uncharacterized alkaline shock family protein YloU